MNQGIGWAVKAMQNGEKVRRAGWNGKGMWISLSGPNGPREIAAESFWSMNAFDYAQQRGGSAEVLPCIIMLTATGQIQMGWVCSQADLLAVDWELA